MLGRRFSEVADITNAGAVPALGARNVKVTLPRRQGVRLETAVLHFNFTTATVATTPSRDGLEALASEIRLIASDSAGASRPIIKAPGSFLTHWSKDRVGKVGRFTQRCLGVPPVNTTYDLFYYLHIYQPQVNSVIANRLSLPLSDRIGENLQYKGVDDDPRIEIDFASNMVPLGSTVAGSLTMNYAKVHWLMREMSPAVQYVPQGLDYSLLNAFTSTAEQSYDIPGGGYLMSLGIEEFTSATARGSALDVTPGSIGLFKLRYGRTDLQTWSSKLAMEWGGQWMQDYPDQTTGFTNDRNPQSFHVVDLLQDTPIGEAVSGMSCLNLYTENRGDAAKLVFTRPVNAANVGVATHKLFGPIEALNGI